MAFAQRLNLAAIGRPKKSKDTTISLMAVSLGLLALVPIVIAATWSEIKYREESARIEREQEVQVQLKLVLSIVQDAETGERGYLLTGKEEYLAPYTSAQESITSALAGLRHRIGGDAERGALVDDVETLVVKRMDELQQIIGLRQIDRTEDAFDLVLSSRGNLTMDLLRAAVNKMEAKEQDMIRRMQEHQANTRTIAYRIELAACVLFLVVVFFTLRQLYRSAVAQRNAARALRQSNDELESTVAARTDQLATANVELRGKIEAHEEAERALRSAREHLQLILDSVGEGVYGIDNDGKTTFVNPYAERLTGYSFEELEIGNTHHLIHHSRPDGRTYPLEECLIYKAMIDGKIMASSEEVFWRKDGSSFPVDYTSSPLHGLDGGIIGAVVTFRDISAQKEAQQRIERYNQELEHSNQELEQFAYVASHDLKAPLRGIQQLVEWITQDLGDQAEEKTAKYLSQLKNRAERLQKLLEGLLAYSRIGRRRNAVVEVDTRERFAQAVELLSAPEGFEIDVIGSFPALRTDQAAFDLVAMNLIGNAIKHHDRTEGRIEVSAVDHGDYVEFQVKDDGPGILDEFQDKVFGMFQTLRPRDELEATGMGLAFVKKTVTDNGGTVEIHSSPEQSRGTTFCFTWPKESTHER